MEMVHVCLITMMYVAKSNWGEYVVLARDLQLYADKGTFEGMSMVAV